METYPKRKSRFKTGMFLLENITSGMYNDPLAILREYIQNSVDSIDLAHNDAEISSAEIRIDLDPFNKRVVIHDNGQGIPNDLSEEVLCSIGSSNKAGYQQRGFRGIGRLGGIAFSDRAVFRTKAEGEVVESIQEWDCVNLRKIIGERQKENFTLSQILSRITSFTKENQKENKGSYFEVTLEGVKSFRNYLFDITRVERFLSQVAPVPFDPKFFKYRNIVEEYLEKKLSHYRRYNIILNGEHIFKPYNDYVRVTKGGIDRLLDIEFFDIKGMDDELIAAGWYGRRDELLGSIARGDDSSGIRVRAGNIMIGDNHLLDGCFREARFNNYIPGELHIESANLVPNSRRDDFVDNDYKNLFYNGVEKELGLPISKKIRHMSRVHSKQKAEQTPAEIPQAIHPIIPVKEASPSVPESITPIAKQTMNAENVLKKLLAECGDCPKLQGILKENTRT